MKDEPVDILDEQGQKTGQVMMKSEVHAQSMWHPVVHLWIYNSHGQALMQKRAPQKIVWPNKWDVAVAGHLAAGETPEDALIKEAREELGLTLAAGEAKFIENFKFEYPMPGDWINRIFIHLYALEADINFDELKLEEEEVSEVMWVDIEEISRKLKDDSDNDITPDIKYYLEGIIAKLHGR